MQDPMQMQFRLCAEAEAAENSGRLEDAAAGFRRAIGLNGNNPTPYLFLGFSLSRLGRQDKAVQAWSLAADLDPRAINAWRNPAVAPNVKLRSKVADEAIRSHFTSQHRETIARFQRERPQADIDRIAAAIWCQTHDSEFEYRHPRQKPHLFYVPDLAPIPVYGADHMPWQRDLEAAWEDIRVEFLAANEQAAAEQKPYLAPRAAGLGEDWKPIADSLNWGSFHLYKQGVGNERLIELFPKTLEALAPVPVLTTVKGPREILFSVLQGRQRIPPHFGVSNTDSTVHLPIVITEDSAIRVVDEVYHWEQGKLFAFDDAFDHESWNDSSEARVNLLFEAWHPDLTDDEQLAIAATFDAREAWNATRRI